mgnify:FL=1
MIDLHTHLLPGIDDGPSTLAESLALCRLATTSGTTHAICTPHIHPGRWENTRTSIQAECNKLQQALSQQKIPLQLGFAAEVRLTDEIISQVTNNEIPFYGELNGYQIMLLEFPHSHIIPGSDKLIQWLMNKKIRPLIAHPERNRQVMKDPALLKPFIDAGCWLQVTAGSVIGAFGEGARDVASMLLDEDNVSVIASDGHNMKARPPSLMAAYENVRDRYGLDRATRLIQDNPADIVATQLDVRQPVVI